MATRSPVVNHDSLVLALLPEAVSADGYEVRRLYVGIDTHEILRAVAPAALILDTPRDKPAAIWQLRGIVRGDAALDPLPRVVCVERDQMRAHATALAGPSAVILTTPCALDDLLHHLMPRMVGSPHLARGDDRRPCPLRPTAGASRG